MRGRGFLLHGGEEGAFESGDLLFVASWLWIAFYSPQGDEVPRLG
jgi:hypothetical protein